MKKLFTLFAVSALALGANADDLTIEINGGTLVKDGAGILFNTMNPNDIELMDRANVGGYLKAISNVDDLELNVKFTADAANQSFIQFCTNACYNIEPGSTQTFAATLMEEEDFLMMIDAVWAPYTEVRTYKGTLEISVGETLYKSYETVFTNDPSYSGVAKLTADGEFRVNGKNVAWNCKGAPGVMTIYTADGRVAGRYDLNSASGNLTLNLAPGLYIWSAGGNTGKVLIGK